MHCSVPPFPLALIALETVLSFAFMKQGQFEYLKKSSLMSIGIVSLHYRKAF